MARRLLAMLALTLTLLTYGLLIAYPASADEGKGGQRTAQGTTPYVSILSDGPLVEIHLGVDASAQIGYAGDAFYEVYPEDVIPGDYGTFLVVDDTLYAPNFEEHGATATDDLGSYIPFTPVSQTDVTGSGTEADPYQVTTVVDAGTTGLTISQVDSYVVGGEAYRTDVTITNIGTANTDAILYRAMDCYLGGSDNGYGLVDPTNGSVACTKTPNNNPAGRIEQLYPLTGGSQYYQADYFEVWAAIGSHEPFPNTCQCDAFIDNGMGLSWTISVPAGESVSYSHLTTFSPLGRAPLTTSKVAADASSMAGETNGYTITLTNPNAEMVQVDRILDTLPEGFSYVPSSTTGATTTDPVVEGQTLIWTGMLDQFILPANGSLSLSFEVTVADTPGIYYNEASADAVPYTVVPTGPTAPITVEEQTSVTLGYLDSTAGRGVPWVLVGAVALAGLVLMGRYRRRS